MLPPQVNPKKEVKNFKPVLVDPTELDVQVEAAPAVTAPTPTQPVETPQVTPPVETPTPAKVTPTPTPKTKTVRVKLPHGQSVKLAGVPEELLATPEGQQEVTESAMAEWLNRREGEDSKEYLKRISPYKNEFKDQVKDFEGDILKNEKGVKSEILFRPELNGNPEDAGLRHMEKIKTFLAGDISDEVKELAEREWEKAFEYDRKENNRFERAGRVISDTASTLSTVEGATNAAKTVGGMIKGAVKAPVKLAKDAGQVVGNSIASWILGTVPVGELPEEITSKGKTGAASAAGTAFGIGDLGLLAGNVATWGLAATPAGELVSFISPSTAAKAARLKEQANVAYEEKAQDVGKATDQEQFEGARFVSGALVPVGGAVSKLTKVAEGTGKAATAAKAALEIQEAMTSGVSRAIKAPVGKTAELLTTPLAREGAKYGAATVAAGGPVKGLALYAAGKSHLFGGMLNKADGIFTKANRLAEGYKLSPGGESFVREAVKVIDDDIKGFVSKLEDPGLNEKQIEAVKQAIAERTKAKRVLNTIAYLSPRQGVTKAMADGLVGAVEGGLLNAAFALTASASNTDISDEILTGTSIGFMASTLGGELQARQKGDDILSKKDVTKLVDDADFQRDKNVQLVDDEVAAVKQEKEVQKQTDKEAKEVAKETSREGDIFYKERSKRIKDILKDEDAELEASRNKALKEEDAVEAERARVEEEQAIESENYIKAVEQAEKDLAAEQTRGTAEQAAFLKEQEKEYLNAVKQYEKDVADELAWEAQKDKREMQAEDEATKRDLKALNDTIAAYRKDYQRQKARSEAEKKAAAKTQVTAEQAEVNKVRAELTKKKLEIAKRKLDLQEKKLAKMEAEIDGTTNRKSDVDEANAVLGQVRDEASTSTAKQEADQVAQQYGEPSPEDLADAALASQPEVGAPEPKLVDTEAKASAILQDVSGLAETGTTAGKKVETKSTGEATTNQAEGGTAVAVEEAPKVKLVDEGEPTPQKTTEAKVTEDQLSTDAVKVYDDAITAGKTQEEALKAAEDYLTANSADPESVTTKNAAAKVNNTIRDRQILASGELIPKEQLVGGAPPKIKGAGDVLGQGYLPVMNPDGTYAKVTRISTTGDWYKLPFTEADAVKFDTYLKNKPVSKRVVKAKAAVEAAMKPEATPDQKQTSETAKQELKEAIEEQFKLEGQTEAEMGAARRAKDTADEFTAELNKAKQDEKIRRLGDDTEKSLRELVWSIDEAEVPAVRKALSEDLRAEFDRVMKEAEFDAKNTPGSTLQEKKTAKPDRKKAAAARKAKKEAEAKVETELTNLIKGGDGVQAIETLIETIEAADEKLLNGNLSPEDTVRYQAYKDVATKMKDNVTNGKGQELYGTTNKLKTAAQRSKEGETRKKAILVDEDSTPTTESPKSKDEMMREERDKRRGILPPDAQIPKTGKIKGSKAAKWADEYIKESQKRINSGIDPTLVAAYAVKLAEKIEEWVSAAQIKDWNVGGIVDPEVTKYLTESSYAKLKQDNPTLANNFKELLVKLDYYGLTPMHYAARKQILYKIPKELITKEALTVKNNPVIGRTPLHYAAESGALNQIPKEFLTKELLTIEDAYGNGGSRRGETPLTRAAEYGNLDQIPASEFLKINWRDQLGGELFEQNKDVITAKIKEATKARLQALRPQS